jgi:hypothetical protein
MTPAEFHQWRQDWTIRFPDCKQWFTANPRTLDLWFREIFAPLEFDDVLMANAELFQESALNRWDYQNVPIRVMQIARRRAWERSEAAKVAAKPNYPPMRYDEGERPLGERFREIVAAKGITLGGDPHDRPRQHPIVLDESEEVPF